MTRFAPPTLIACPHCEGILHKSQLASFSSRATQYWTDRQNNTPFANVVAPLVRCPLCQNLFWKSEAKEIGNLPWQPSPMSRLSIWYAKLTRDKEKKLAEQDAWNKIPTEFKNAPDCIPSEFADWLEVLQSSAKLSSEREMEARRNFWRTSNDHVRIKTDGQPCRAEPALTEAEANANRLALLQLLEDNASSASTEKAELLRQLGRFDEAVQILQSASQKEHSPLAEKIMQLAKNCDISIRDVQG